MKPKYSFSTKTFLIGLAFLVAGLALGYWQYQRWFNPEVIAGVAIQKFSLGGILLALACLLGGILAIFNAFRGGAEPALVYLPKEKFEMLKKAIEIKEISYFEKLLDGEHSSEPQEAYAALSIERFKDQPGLATVQGSMRLMNSSGQFYDTKSETEKITVEGAVFDILEKIEKRYGSEKAY